MTQFSYLKTWDDIVSRAAEYREKRDGCSFELGDLTLFACGDATPGRPTDGRKEHTVSALAAAIGEERSVLSNLMWNSYFWNPTDREKLPPNVSWRQCSEARRRSGWKPGAEITAKQKEFAWTLVFRAADGDQVIPRSKPETCVCPTCGREHRLQEAEKKR